jgi:hypothetical protein
MARLKIEPVVIIAAMAGLKIQIVEGPTTPTTMTPLLSFHAILSYIFGLVSRNTNQ